MLLGDRPIGRHPAVASVILTHRKQKGDCFLGSCDTAVRTEQRAMPATAPLTAAVTAVP